MTTIYYNPWDSACKKPFGAVVENAAVTFRMQVLSKNARLCKLVIFKDGGDKREYIEMQAQAESWFEVTVHLTQGTGLYFYYFQMIEQTATGIESYQFYQWANGGVGEVTHDEAHIKSFQLTCFNEVDAGPQWFQEAVFYQIFPDRFYNGNSNKQVNSPKKNSFLYGTMIDDPLYVKNTTGDVIRWDFYGGNLQGIIAKLPYLKELGVTALYLNPIFQASSNHRYDTNDYLLIDEILGTEEDFKALVRSVHQAGMHLILDGVFSHVGKNSRYFNQGDLYDPQTGAARTQSSPYYPWFTFTQYPRVYKSWWGIVDLPVINKANPDYQQFIYGEKNSVLAKWNGLGVDGWRLDVADELPDEFIEGIRKRLTTYPETILIGEVWEDATNKVAYDKRRRYTQGGNLQSVMNYPLRDLILNLLTNKVTGKAFCLAFTQLQENYPRTYFYQLFNNLGTHDTKRLLTKLNDNSQLASLALGILFFLPGVPCLYYGDEVGLSGGKDPANRKFYPWNREDLELLADTKEWIARRKTSPVLVAGECYVFTMADCLGIARVKQQAWSLLIVNPNDTNSQLATEFWTPRELPATITKAITQLNGQIVAANHYVIKQSQ